MGKIQAVLVAVLGLGFFALPAHAQFRFTSTASADGPSTPAGGFSNVTCYANGGFTQVHCGPSGFPGGTSGDLIFQGRNGGAQSVVALGADGNPYLSYGAGGSSTSIGVTSEIIMYNYVSPTLYWSGVDIFQSSGSRQTVTVAAYSDTSFNNLNVSVTAVIPSGVVTTVTIPTTAFAAARISFPSAIVWGANAFAFGTTAPSAPDAPTIGTATAGNGSASVAFSAPADDGGSAITGYTATSSPGGLTGTCASSPCTVTGLINGVDYTFTVVATNANGDSSASGVSNSVMPASIVGFSGDFAPANWYSGVQVFGCGSSAISNNGSTVVMTTANNCASSGASYQHTNGGSGVTRPGTAFFSYAVTESQPHTYGAEYGVTASGGTAVASSAPASGRASQAVGEGEVLFYGVGKASGFGVTTFTISEFGYLYAPDAPTGVTATAGVGEATVAWTTPADPGDAAISGYTVTSVPGGLTCTTASTSCTVSGLSKGTAYTFTVTATNSWGTSNASVASASVTPAPEFCVTRDDTAAAGNGYQACGSGTAEVRLGGSPLTYNFAVTDGGRTCYPNTIYNGNVSGNFDSDGTDPAGCGCFFTTPDSRASGTIAVSDSAIVDVPIYCATSLSMATAPGAPIIGTATPGNGEASVAFSAPASDGGSAITGYTATSSPGGLTGSCASSPCTVIGLTNGTAYTFTVIATNAVGNSAASAASNSVTPDADSDGDGTGDLGDAFPEDPVEDTDSDGDGIGDNGDAGGTGLGVRIVGAPATCGFNGAVQASATQFVDSAPGQAFGTQLNFVLSNCGSSVDIEALFGEDLPAGSVAYKVTPAGAWIAIPGAVVSGNRVTYTVTDNGPLDDDAVLGQITDPVTVVLPRNLSPNSIPVLPAALLALLSGLVGWLGWRRLAT